MIDLGSESEDESGAEPSPDTTALFFDRDVEHPDEFIKFLTGVTAPWMRDFGSIRPWFRGVPKVSFSLEPSLLRYRPRKLVATEHNLVHQFSAYAARFLEGSPVDTTELLTIMQHHGAPTRLLDWTESAFAALYFAVREQKYFADPEDAVVWLLEPLRLAEIQYKQRTIPFSSEEIIHGPMPSPFYPNHRTSRLTTQRGAFTIHPIQPQHSLVSLALEEVKEGRPSPLRALRIKGSRRQFIRGALVDAFGQGEFTFFPDLDGLARELRMRECLEGLG
jgi:hypothetical protein